MKVSTSTHEKCPDELVYLYEIVQKDPFNKLADNYKFKNIFTDYTLCYSVTLDEAGEPIAGSIVWKRPFYNGSVRIGTRYAIHPRTRSSALKLKDENYQYGIRTYAVEQLDQQIEFVENLGIYDQFISREDKKGLVSKRVFHGLQVLSRHDWTIHPGFCLVCPNEKSDSCWQRVAYRGILKI
jgi:hypothetical protein